MSDKLARITRRIYAISAFVLAVSFFLPLTVRTTYVDAEGKLGGLLRQWFPGAGAEGVTSPGFVWENMEWTILLIFFVPVVLVALRKLPSQKLRSLITWVTPLAAGLLLFSLIVIVWLSDFSILPGNIERSYGGFVALGALICFFVSSIFLVVAVTSGGNYSDSRGCNHD